MISRKITCNKSIVELTNKNIELNNINMAIIVCVINDAVIRLLILININAAEDRKRIIKAKCKEKIKKIMLIIIFYPF